MVGKLMAAVRGKYIKRYQDIIGKCKGQYKSIEELREDFLLLTRKTLFMLPPALITVLVLIALLLRRVL